MIRELGYKKQDTGADAKMVENVSAYLALSQGRKDVEYHLPNPLTMLPLGAAGIAGGPFTMIGGMVGLGVVGNVAPPEAVDAVLTLKRKSKAGQLMEKLLPVMELGKAME